MTPEQELAHLRAPSEDPKQRMIDYWGHRAEVAEARVEELWNALDAIWQISGCTTRLKVNMTRINDLAGYALVARRALEARTQADLSNARAEIERG